MKKLKEMLVSKKFIVTSAGVIVVVANDYFGLHLDKETIIGVVTMVVTYVAGQSHVDGKKVSK
jgi:hypothetical protein